MAKVKKPEVKEVKVEAEPKFVSAVPNKIDNRQLKFVAVAFGAQFYVFNPEGVRVSGPLAELEATELATRFNKR